MYLNKNEAIKLLNVTTLVELEKILSETKMNKKFLEFVRVAKENNFNFIETDDDTIWFNHSELLISKNKELQKALDCQGFGLVVSIWETSDFYEDDDENDVWFNTPMYQSELNDKNENEVSEDMGRYACITDVISEIETEVSYKIREGI